MCNSDEMYKHMNLEATRRALGEVQARLQNFVLDGRSCGGTQHSTVRITKSKASVEMPLQTRRCVRRNRQIVACRGSTHTTVKRQWYSTVRSRSSKGKSSRTQRSVTSLTRHTCQEHVACGVTSRDTSCSRRWGSVDSATPTV
jgi:hypothetical protein